MKRYSFRLATVLRVRIAEEERDRARLMASNIALRSSIERRDGHLARCSALQVTSGSSSVDDFRIAQQAVELAARAYAHSSREVTNAAAVAALAQIDWQTSSRRVAIIERLDERRREEYLAEERKAEIALSDDLVTARFVLEHRDDALETQQ